MRPTSSDPVTLTPRSSALRHTSSKATCTGVTPILVRFIEICAKPYSGIYHPMAFTAFSDPGIMTGLPSASLTTLPVMGLPSRFSRPVPLHRMLWHSPCGRGCVQVYVKRYKEITGTHNHSPGTGIKPRRPEVGLPCRIFQLSSSVPHTPRP
jgi:hypothetical protein